MRFVQLLSLSITLSFVLTFVDASVSGGRGTSVSLLSLAVMLLAGAAAVVVYRNPLPMPLILLMSTIAATYGGYPSYRLGIAGLTDREYACGNGTCDLDAGGRLFWSLFLGSILAIAVGLVLGCLIAGIVLVIRHWPSRNRT